MMRVVQVEKDELLVSFDVCSLFTNVPVDEAVKVIHRKVKQDKTVKDRTILSPDRRVELLEVCLRSTYFSYDGTAPAPRFYKWSG